MAGARILAVEDEFLIRMILVETLTNAGFEVVEAADGEEAVALLDRGHDFALLVTDVQMPGPYDGVALARHARERIPDLPIVFATGRPDSIRAAYGALRERDACVRKPYGPAEILTVVRDALGAQPPGPANA